MKNIKEKIAKASEKGGGLLTEFKEFAMKGNVIDMAVGVVIGGAFGKIVTSLVNDIIMPLVSVITGNIDFSNLKYVHSYMNSAGEKVKVDENTELLKEIRDLLKNNK